jgi:hypothetical protein
MTAKQRPIANLLVTIAGVQYVLGTLRFNAGELSYFFTYPKNSPDNQLYYETGESTPQLEHITWHDERIHIKRKDNVAIEVIDYAGPLLITPPVLTPLYVESLYFNIDEEPCLRRADEFTPWKGSVSQEILSIDRSTGFSLILLLAPSKETTSKVLMRLQFQDPIRQFPFTLHLADVCDSKHRPGRLQVWNDWDIIVITTPFVQKTLSPIPPSLGSCRLPNYRNIPAALTDLVCQANGIPKRP